MCVGELYVIRLHKNNGYQNISIYDKSSTHNLPERPLFRLEQNRKLHIIFSEALGKVSPKIRRLRRLWREGFPERQFSRA